MRVPSIIYADDLQDWSEKVDDKNSGRWVLARPISSGGICFLWRLRLAWKVFTGKVDVLAWKAEQN